MSKEFSVGQLWTYPSPEGFEDSRVLIGGIMSLENADDIICVSVLNAAVPRRQAQVSRATIPFLPFTRTAMEKTVLELDGSDEVPEEFDQAFEAWKDDTNAKDFFTVALPALLSELYFALQDEEGMLNMKNDDAG